MEKIGQILVTEGLVSEEQLNQALSEQKQTNDLLGAIVVRRGWVSEEQLVDMLSRQFNLPSVQLDSVAIEPSMAQLVPAGAARRGKCVPIRKTGNTLEIATASPEDRRVAERIAQQTGLQVSVCIAGPEAVERALTRLYGGKARPRERAVRLGRRPRREEGREARAPAKKVDLKGLSEQMTRAVQEAGGDARMRSWRKRKSRNSR